MATHTYLYNRHGKLDDAALACFQLRECIVIDNANGTFFANKDVYLEVLDIVQTLKHEVEMLEGSLKDSLKANA